MKRNGMFRSQIEECIQKNYHVSGEYLWKQFPEYAVFRHPENEKWFAIMMNPTWEELHLPGEGTTDILVVKCPENLREEYEGTPGILPAYHMNKKNWITLLADGTLSPEIVCKFLQTSYDLTLKN